MIKDIVAEALPRIPLNGNQETTHKPTYQLEIVLETKDIEELPECNFLINIRLIQKYHQKGPSIIDKYKTVTYHKGSFHGGSNVDLSLITWKGKIVIL